MKRRIQFDAGRVSAISDGVFAIAMTLLVLDLKLPELETGMSREEFAAVRLWAVFPIVAAVLVRLGEPSSRAVD